MCLTRDTLELARRTCVVTVTYGNRFRFLQQVIDAAFKEGVGKVIVVDNASVEDSRQALQELAEVHSKQLVVIHLPRNMGSAGGYKRGLECFMNCPDCDYVWLLDDDNVPLPGALIELLKYYTEFIKETPPDCLALLSTRTATKHQRKLAWGVPISEVFPSPSAFLGFDVRDVLVKLLRRVLGELKFSNRESCLFAEIPWAPYGGLFFHKIVLTRIGLPDERFFVYTDDTEYTNRLTRLGGRILMVKSSIINDIEQSWKSIVKRLNLPYSIFVESPSDLRVYMTVRNQTYFERNFRIGHPILYILNAGFILLLIALLCLMYRRPRRFMLILRAVRDGLKGRLGTVWEER